MYGSLHSNRLSRLKFVHARSHEWHHHAPCMMHASSIAIIICDHHQPSSGCNHTNTAHSRPLNMNRYDLREELGDGTFGTVFRALNRNTHEEVRSASCLHANNNKSSRIAKATIKFLVQYEEKHD